MFNNEKNNFFEEELKQSQALTSESESFESTADIEAGNDTGEALIDGIENFDNGDTANAESGSYSSKTITDELESFDGTETLTGGISNFDSTTDAELENDIVEGLTDDIENLDESDTTVIKEKNNDDEALTDEAESSDNTDADKEESYDLEGLIDESENLDDATDKAIDNLSDPMIHKEVKNLIDDTTSDNEDGIEDGFSESNDDDFQKLVDSILNSTEDDDHAVNSNDGMPVMPLTVYKMLMSAKQMRTVLTGIVTGVRMTSKGMAVEVTTQV